MFSSVGNSFNRIPTFDFPEITIEIPETHFPAINHKQHAATIAGKLQEFWSNLPVPEITFSAHEHDLPAHQEKIVTPQSAYNQTQQLYETPSNQESAYTPPRYNFIDADELSAPSKSSIRHVMDIFSISFAILVLLGSFVWAYTNPISIFGMQGGLGALLYTPDDIPPERMVQQIFADETSDTPVSQSEDAPITVPEKSSVSENPSTNIQYVTSNSLVDLNTLQQYLSAGSNISLSQQDGKLFIAAASYPNLESQIPLDGDTLTKTSSGIKLNDSLLQKINTLSSGGAVADVFADIAGDTITGKWTFNNSGSGNTLAFNPTGDSGYLSSSGGVIFLNNTFNPGTGIGIYSNAGAEAQGNMINVKVDNPNYNQAAFYMNYDGSSNAVEITSNTVNDSSSNALAVTSYNALDSAIGFIGYENGRGTVKISHYKNPGFSDANASGLSIDLKDASNGEQTSAQGIYVDSTATNGTLGNLLRLRNQTIDRFVVNRFGSLQVGASGTDSTITKLGNNSGDQFFVGTTGAFRVQRSAANSEAFRVQVNGDSQGRWLGTSDGQLKWGPGNVTQDVTLRRTAAGLLALEGGIVLNNNNADYDSAIKGTTDSNLLFADSSADAIGIGISTPQSKLHVVGDIRVTGGYVDSSGDLGGSGQILSSTATGTNWIDANAVAGNPFQQNGNTFGTNAVLGTNDGFPLIMRTNSLEAIRIDTNQQVGIGATVPSTRLTVTGADLNTQADQTVGTALFNGTLNKDDTSTRTFAGLRIIPTINAGASNANTTLNVLDVNTVNTSVTGVTRNLLRLADGGTTRFLVQSGGNVVATATTTGGQAYQYNFNSITTGTGIILNVNALTSGNGLHITSSATSNGMIGNLANFDFTGNHAGNTGTVFRASSSGTNNTGTVGMITNLGNGLSFRVNDESGDSDTSPFAIDNSGNVAIGATAVTAGAKLDVNGTIRVGTLSGGPSANTLCYDASNVIVPCSSSRQYKSDINSMGASLNQIMQLRPVTFTWKENGQNSLGLIAEEVDQINPLLVARDGQGNIQSVRYDYLSALLAKGIQEQQEEIDKLNDSLGITHSDSTKALTDTSIIDTRVTSLEEKTSSISAEISALMEKDQTEQFASLSAELASLKFAMETLRGDVLSASTSALLSESTDTFTTTDTTDIENLTVLNKTATNNLFVMGTATFGTLSITSEADNSISMTNLSGPIRIQEIPAQEVQFMNNKITFETDGDIVLREGKLKGNDTSRGINITVDENASSIRIQFSKTSESDSYAVSVAPSWLTQFAVQEKSKEGFTVHFATPAPAQATIDWMVQE